MATDLAPAPARPHVSPAVPPTGSGLPPNVSEAGSPPVSPREIVAVAASVVAFDLLVYRGHGFAGHAAFFVAACLLVLLGSPYQSNRISATVLGLMMVALAIRLVWLGYGALNVLATVLLVAFAMAVAGRRPYAIDVAIYGLLSFVAGLAALVGYVRSFNRHGPVVPRATWLKFALPVVAVLGFGTIFILANPDVATVVGERLARFFNRVWEALSRFSPTFGEVLLCAAVALFVGGLLRPIVRTWALQPFSRPDDSDEAPLFESPFYAAYRNTLVAVIVLFALYLVFEFKTLWFQTFPEGFYYAGYAHEGAAWLTVALALTTFVLSAIFRESTMNDPRIARLQRLA